jgi:serine/threonine protein kinase
MDFMEAHLDHPNVLKTLGGGCSVLHDTFNNIPDTLYAVTEIAENGDLMDFLMENGKLTAPTARQVFSQILEGVKYMLEEY